MKKVVILILFFFLGFAFIPMMTVIAEDNRDFPVEQFPYSEVSIMIMPEFTTPEGWPINQAAVLIGYHGKIINQTGKAYSGKIEFPIPTKEKNFTLGYLAQYPDQAEELIELNSEINQENGTIHWNPAEPIAKGQSYEFVIEYYYTPKKDSTLTSFSYSLSPEAVVDHANIVIYQPVGANEFKISPITDYRSQNKYGVPMYIYQYTNLAKGQKKDFQISYVKEGTKSTLDYIHDMQIGGNPHAANQNAKVIQYSTKPLVSNSGAYAISIAIVFSAILFFLAMRNRRIVMTNGMMAETNSTLTAGEEIKHLRKQYAEGSIDHQTYLEKLNNIRGKN